MISDYENGGLKMIDIKLFNSALKSGWIKKYLDKENHGNGNFCLIWNYEILAVKKFFEVSSVKKICQNTSKYRIALL